MKKIFIFLFMLVASFGVFTVSNANATSDGLTQGTNVTKTKDDGKSGALGIVLCNVLNFVTGTVGKTIASFIIIGVGVGFFSGKVSWGLLIGVTLGISAMFGAPAIIKAITGGDATTCDSN